MVFDAQAVRFQIFTARSVVQQISRSRTGSLDSLGGLRNRIPIIG